MKFLTGKYKQVNGMLKTLVNGKRKIPIISFTKLRKRKMTEKFCTKCNKMCHCLDAGSGDCLKNLLYCENGRNEDATYEGGGVVIDDTNECEWCQ